MGNLLDEETGPIKEEGREVNVIAKQIPVKVGVGSTIFQVILWILFIIPGIIFTYKKAKAKAYLLQLEQKINKQASEIDNYMEQRVIILQNLVKLVEKAITLDSTVFKEIAEVRGNKISDEKLNEISRQINVQLEAYPDLRAHSEISDAIQQNSYTQREITAARTRYNDTVNQWNKDIFAWPTKMIVAAKEGYTTRIPFIASKEIKEKSKEVFF